MHFQSTTVWYLKYKYTAVGNKKNKVMRQKGNFSKIFLEEKCMKFYNQLC
jgi:hypothetical protein